MNPRRELPEGNSKSEALGRLWDALQESETLCDPEIEASDFETITQLHTAQDVQPPDDDLINRMWSSIVEASPSLQPRLVTTTQLNGHGATVDVEIPVYLPAAAVTDTSPVHKPSTFSCSLRLLAVWTRLLGIAALSGFLIGALTLGGGGRIAMRIAAMFSADELQGVRTENLETVGAITLSGTINLLISGGFAGAALGIGYLAIRRWLPAIGWQRNLTSGIVFFSICGFVALDGGGNADYKKFGIAGLNICLFTLLPLFFGLSIAPLVEKLDRSIHEDVLSLSRSPTLLLKVPAIGLILLFTMGGTMMLLILTPLQLLLLLPATTASFRFLFSRFQFLEPSSFGPWPGRLALIVPSLIGLLFTAFAAGRII